MARQPIYGAVEWDLIVRSRRHHATTTILRLAANGYRDPQIAKLMHYSLHTIKEWWNHIRKRLGARNRTHAVAIAVRQGII